ncbi:MAG: hypothetical protein HOV80_34315 [Polyangiaceae bacterium]|nr:hypothetical protein [Polyangiaceae bacterium]
MAAIGWLSALPACVPEGPATKEESSPPPEETPEVQGDPELTEPFRDDFERASIGDDYLALSPVWGIDGGRVCAEGAKNHGLWLRRRLPRAVRIELDAIAQTEEGDLKVELWGDGKSGATKESYDDATGYIAIFGGWRNSQHVLARLDEHADNRLGLEVSPTSEDPRAQPALPGNRYRFKFERKQGNILAWYVDGRLLFEFDDPKPLAGAGHDHFAFNNWTAKVCFDNLEIVPL